MLLEDYGGLSNSFWLREWCLSGQGSGCRVETLLFWGVPFHKMRDSFTKLDIMELFSQQKYSFELRDLISEPWVACCFFNLFSYFITRSKQIRASNDQKCGFIISIASSRSLPSFQKGTVNLLKTWVPQLKSVNFFLWN